MFGLLASTLHSARFVVGCLQWLNCLIQAHLYLHRLQLLVFYHHLTDISADLQSYHLGDTMAHSVLKSSSALLFEPQSRSLLHTRLVGFSTMSKQRPRKLLKKKEYRSNAVKLGESELGRNFDAEADTKVVIEFEDRKKQEEYQIEQLQKPSNILMFSVAPACYLLLAALPGAEAVKSIFGPFVEVVRSWNLPDWLVHWGHPGNMAVVLLAMGGYGSYLGWQIRLSDNVEVKAQAKDLHPKLLGGMFFFFALGATGGITSLLTSDKPILESPHAVTGTIGLALLTIQTLTPVLFEGNPGLRTIHGFLGSGIMGLFFIHAILGLQLGLSY